MWKLYRNPQNFQNFLSKLVNNNLYGKWVSKLEFPINLDERFKFVSAPFLIPDFNLSSYELDNSTYKVLYVVILYCVKAK